MIYLVVCIMCSVLWAISYKITIRRGCHPLGTISSVAFWSLLIILILFNFDLGIRVHTVAAALGSGTGLCLYFAMLTYFYLIKRGARLGVSWTILSLSMIIPTTVSIIIYIPSRKELTMGMIMGIGGMGNMYFILLALRGISGIVAFPLRTCGNLVFTVFVSFFIWNERITKLEIIGLVLASSSIIMINL